MTIIIHTTPWGVCQRYYDERGVLLYSHYVTLVPSQTAVCRCRANEVRRNGRLPSRANLAAERKKTGLSVEIAAA